MKILVMAALSLACVVAQANWVVQASGAKVQFRGVAAVSGSVAWAAGADGTYARTTDGFAWSTASVPGAEQMVFRSVVAWDADHATLLAIGKGEASRIYHTDDGGAHWQLQFTNPDPNAFYDAIQFWDRLHGIALGDPVDGHFRILRTDDGGKTWAVQTPTAMPEALTGEGAFAASGTCLVVHGASDAWFATGGASVSRVFHSHDRGRHWSVANTPIPAGKDTAGIFGLCFLDAKRGLAVGGDYKTPTAGQDTVAATTDGGRTWTGVGSGPSAAAAPAGLLEGVAFVDSKLMVAVGPSRTGHAAYTAGSGRDGPALDWRSDVSDQTAGLHACSFVGGITDPMAQTGWAVGDNGLIVKWIWRPG